MEYSDLAERHAHRRAHRVAGTACPPRRTSRSSAGPGAVLADGRLAGLWRGRARGQRVEIAVEALERIDSAALEAEAETVAAARGSLSADVVWA